MKALPLVLLLALPPLAHAAEPPNLLVNPGFEELDATGKPVGWSLPADYAVTTGDPRSGERCLTYTNPDPGRYLLATQTVTLQPGLRYELSGWVRTSDVAGDESGATICVEWYTGNTYRGGMYPNGFKGTQATWQPIRALTGHIPNNADRFIVHCYLRKGMTGTAWFDDLVVRQYRPPLVGSVITSAYRNVVADGIVDVLAELNLVDNQVAPDQTTANLRVLDAAGKAVLTIPGTVAADRATWQLDAGRLPAGEYTLEVAAKAGDLPGTATATLRRVDQLPQRHAWIDQHRRLIVDGEPFFPLGTYWSSVKPEDVELYAQSPFNCVMPYGGASREQLDLLHTKAIKLIYSVKDLYHGTTWAPKDILTVEDERKAIERVVAEKGDHPAIIAWYINDELPLTMLEQLSAHRDWLEELDPGRPTWVVLYQVDQVRSYLPTFDVIGTDPYPIPTRPPSTALDYSRKTFNACYGTRAVWQVPQIFDWAAYRPEAEQRPPTYDEMRSMAWSCIAAGANGLIFYSWFDLWKMDKKPQPEPFAERWAEVCRMGRQIQEQIPVLLADPYERRAAVAGPETVQCRLWQKDGEVWLLAVNADTAPATATVTLDETFRTATELLPEDDGTVTVTGRQVTLTFGPLGVQMVKLAR